MPRTTRLPRHAAQGLKQIAASGGTVHGPVGPLAYATDSSGKTIAATTLEHLVNLGHLTPRHSSHTRTWALTTSGRALTKTTKTPSPTSPTSPSAQPLKPTKKTPAQLDREIAQVLDWKSRVRSIMKAAGYQEESDPNAEILSFGDRDESDVGEDAPNAGMIQGARALRDRIKSEVPGVSVRLEAVDEWISITVSKS